MKFIIFMNLFWGQKWIRKQKGESGRSLKVVVDTKKKWPYSTNQLYPVCVYYRKEWESIPLHASCLLLPYPLWTSPMSIVSYISWCWYFTNSLFLAHPFQLIPHHFFFCFLLFSTHHLTLWLLSNVHFKFENWYFNSIVGTIFREKIWKLNIIRYK